MYAHFLTNSFLRFLRPQCGPASGIPRDTCLAIDRERSADRYACSTAYAIDDFSQCEVGDLSGKDGALVVENGAVSKTSLRDPLAAQNTHFVAGTGSNPPNRFSSIVYHDGSPRVLCARLFLAEDAPAPTPPVPPPTSAPIPVPPPTSAPTPVPPPTGGDGCQIEGYELWDGDTGLVDADLTRGQTICNPLFSSGISIRVVAPACDFVELDLRGPDHSSRTERAEPFFLFGDRRGDPRTRTLSVGSYSLEAVGDSVVATEALQFDVIDEVTEACSF